MLLDGDYDIYKFNESAVHKEPPRPMPAINPSLLFNHIGFFPAADTKMIFLRCSEAIMVIKKIRCGFFSLKNVAVKRTWH
jgi:hypothetical protein